MATGKDVQFAGEFITLNRARGDVSTLAFEPKILNSTKIRSRCRRCSNRRVIASAFARCFGILLLLAAVAGISCSVDARAQSEGKDDSVIASERATVTAPVVIDGRVLYRVRGATAFPADQRAAMIAGRIRALAANEATTPSELASRRERILD